MNRSGKKADPIPPPLLGAKHLTFPLIAALVLLAACERVEVDPAVAEGPLPAPTDPIDADLAASGADLFRRGCLACHSVDGAVVVGPSLHDVTSRREYTWIRGMVLNPDSMLRSDERARELFEEYKVPMLNTGLTEAHFRAVLEYLRSLEAESVSGTPPVGR